MDYHHLFVTMVYMEDMAVILSISPTTIYKIEHNISQAKYKTLETILNSLGYELVIKKR